MGSDFTTEFNNIREYELSKYVTVTVMKEPHNPC